MLILTCPPVVSAAPEKSYRTDWDSLIVSAVGFVGDGDIWIMVESSTKKILLVAESRGKCSILKLPRDQNLGGS